MTEEQIQQALDLLDQILRQLERLAESLRKEEADTRQEVVAIEKLPQAFELERTLRTAANQEYLSGRWKRIPGDGYDQPPPPRVPHGDNPAGSV